MRERSTWNRQEIAKKAAEVAGDIYSMNQDHPQPAMDEYVIGDPSDFAEDVHSPNTWEAEYSGDKVKRNEIGMAELRSDTFSHAEKTASDKLRLKKAELCVAVAKLMMFGKKTASADAIEDQAVALMYMPDAELINTHKRLAQEQQVQDEEEEVEESDDDDSEDDDDEGAQQQQQAKQAVKQAKAAKPAKQAGEVPPQFKENIEKMKAKSEGKSEDKSEDKADDDEGGEKKQAADGEDKEIPDFIQKKIDDSKDEDAGDKKQASSAKIIKTLKLAMGQQQQLMAQMQQLLQQAMDQQEPAQAPAVAGLQGPALAQQEVPVQQQQLQVQDDLDQILASDGLASMSEVDIELEPAGMDVDNVVLAGEDEILRSLFAGEDDEQAEEEEDTQQQSKQASVRTASTRTVGTRPTAGVAKLGGSVSKTAASTQVDNLSNLWATAPDVRAAFGMK